VLRYIVRRTLYMIPTVFGVIVATFLLFNWVGGDPAMMKLGKNASPRLLEDFDAQRGYNKPLLWGRWGTTRAFADADFARSAGAWRDVAGAEHRPEAGSLVVRDGVEAVVPLAFDLYPGETYRWLIAYRLPAGRAEFVVRGAADGARSVALAPSSAWRAARLDFRPGADAGELACAVRAGGGDLELRALRLRRGVAHAFDSQLWFYLRQLARLDFGASHETNQRVSTMIRDGLLPSLALTVPMFIAGLLTAVTLALLCAFFRNSPVDRFFVVLGVILMSVNYIVWIVLGQYVLGYGVRLFPVWGFESWRYLVLPCLIGVVSGLGSELRFYRTVMLDEMYRDYVRTAFAKGVGRRGVLFRHVLKNAMIPILTGVVMAIPFLYTGSLLLETFFGIPGLGRMGVNALNSSDVDVIRALVFVGAMIYVVAHLITDISYALVDPRVRLQ